MGPVLPLGEFKSVDNSNLNAGFAGSGFTLNFDGDYYLTHRIAFSARFHFSLSSFNDVEVADWLKQEAGGYYKEDTMAIKSIGYWQWSSPLVGIKYNYPIVINKLYFDAGAFSGVCIASVPTQSLKIDDPDNQQIFYSENITKTNYALPLMLDAGLRLRFNDTIQLKLMASYYQSKITYQHVNYIISESTPLKPQTISTQDMTVPLKTLNFSVGLVYSL